MKQISLFLCAISLSIIGYAHAIETNAILENATGNGNGTTSSYQGSTWIETSASVLDCTNTTSYGSANVSTPGTKTINTCSYFQEYSTISGVNSGYDYEFTGIKNDDSSLAYITVRSGTFDGAVVGSGFSPLTITATSSADLFVHWNKNANCGTGTGCSTTTARCITCDTVPDCEGVPGGSSVPGTICDDGDTATINDVYDASCNCAGELPTTGAVCENAITIDCNADPETFSSTNSNGTNTTSCAMGDKGLWFSFMGTGRDITVNSAATFDHRLSVNTGLCDNLINLVCQDSGTGAENYTILSSTAGEMYSVYIAHYIPGNTTTGNIQFSINCAAAPYPPAIELNSAANFGILAATGITSAGASVISNTNIGVSPGARASITGFPPSEVVNGSIFASDDTAPPGVPAMLAQAKLDLQAAYLFAAGASTPAPATVAGDQGGLTLYPGIYKSNSTLLIQAGDLTLDAQGDPNARWIFQVATALTTIGGAGGNVFLTGGAQAKNITWQVGSSVTVGNNTSFKGNILAFTSITFNTGSTADGRLYAMNGLVALSGNIIIDQPCIPPTNLAVSNITEDSADITWNEGSNETEWEVSYGPPNFDPNGTQGTTVSVTVDPETTLNGLDDDTNYDVYVRAICDVVTEIEWAGPVSFKTSFPCTSTTTYTILGGWDNGTPTSSVEAIIAENYSTILGNIDACQLKVKLGATLTVNANDYVSIENDITVDGVLNIEHEGSLVQIDDDAIVTNNGNINVEKITPTLNNRAFMIVGSPMTAETRDGVHKDNIIFRNHLTGNFVPNQDVADQFPAAENFADNNGDNWVNYRGNINPGEGYLVLPQTTPQISSPSDYTFNYMQGTLNNGIVNYTGLFNTSQNGSPNMIANPYASAIDAEVFMTENANIDVVYFWEHLSGVTSYPGYNSNNYSMGDISMYSQGAMGGIGVAAANGGTAPTQFIASGQGFAFKASSAFPVTFNNSMRVTGPNDTYRNPEQRDIIWLTVQNETYKLGSTMAVGFTENATDGFDQGSDTKRLATPVSLYSELETGEQLAIQARSSFNNFQEVPLSFTTQVEEGTYYTISISNMETANINPRAIYLRDNQNRKIVNLSRKEYKFKTDSGTFQNRFTLFFSKSNKSGEEGNLETEAAELNFVSLTPNPTKGIVTINSPAQPISGVQVFDIRGRLMVDKKVDNKETTNIDLTDLNTAVYFVKIQTENGTITKRIVKE